MACIPSWSKSSCHPVIHVEDQGNCAGPAGGTKTVSSPQFVLEVTNPPNFIWTDEDFTVIQADDDGSVFVFDNI